MAKVTMKLEGMDALQRAISKSPDVVKAHASTVVARTSFAIANRMKVMSRGGPYSVGGLAMAIVADSRSTSGRVLIQPGAYYWRFLEYGTVKMKARPFIRPSTEAESNNFIAGMREIGPKLERAFTGGGLL